MLVDRIQPGEAMDVLVEVWDDDQRAPADVGLEARDALAVAHRESVEVPEVPEVVQRPARQIGTDLLDEPVLVNAAGED